MRRNSGLAITATSAGPPRSRSRALSCVSTRRVVPTGTVLRRATTVRAVRLSAIAAMTLSTAPEVGVSGRARRRADADEDDVRVAQRDGRVRGEAQPPLALEKAELALQVGLVVGSLTALERGELARVGLQAGDVLAHSSQAGGGDEPDVAEADHGDLHGGMDPPAAVCRCAGMAGDAAANQLRGAAGDDTGRLSSPLAPARSASRLAGEHAGER